MASNDLVTVSNIILLAETEKAIGVAVVETDKTPTKVEFWFPKSQIDRQTMQKKGDTGEIDIPRWLAEKHNLDYVD
jgi:hypothetical protein